MFVLLEINWMLIKGVCDYANGNKNYNKDNYQIIATINANNILSKILEYNL